MLKTAAEKTVDNKTFSFLPGSAGEQPAQKNQSTTQDPFTCASRQSGTRKPYAHKETLKWNKALTSSKEYLERLLLFPPHFTGICWSLKYIVLWVHFLTEIRFFTEYPMLHITERTSKS